MKSRLVVVAGPDGCGKTTFALEYLKTYGHPFVSADAIAESMHPASIDDVRLEAGRLFVEQVAEKVDRRESFVVESTLSGFTFRKTLERARQRGYETTIIFVFLGSEMACVARILERVRKGGHAVREEDVLRSFRRSIRNFWEIYRFLADRWQLVYNGGAQFHEVALGEANTIEVGDEILFDTFLRLAETEEGNE